jgi:hypothetical protein
MLTFPLTEWTDENVCTSTIYLPVEVVQISRLCPLLSGNVFDVALALPVVWLPTTDYDTGRASGTQRLDFDRVLIHAKSWVATGWGSLAIDKRIFLNRIGPSGPTLPEGE